MLVIKSSLSPSSRKKSFILNYEILVLVEIKNDLVGLGFIIVEKLKIINLEIWSNKKRMLDSFIYRN